jgi:hypothetical protein
MILENHALHSTPPQADNYTFRSRPFKYLRLKSRSVDTSRPANHTGSAAPPHALQRVAPSTDAKTGVDTGAVWPPQRLEFVYHCADPTILRRVLFFGFDHFCSCD